MIDQDMKGGVESGATAISLYRLLHATDTFDKMYSLLLAKRLLEVDTCDFARETKFIAAYKSEFGEQFNQKVDQMFTDVKESAELTEEFRHSKGKQLHGMEVTFRLIQQKTWPIMQTASEEPKEKTNNRKKGQTDEEMQSA